MKPKATNLINQTISGSFSCPSCGGFTKIDDALNPSPTCIYCGALLPDLLKTIQEKDKLLSDSNIKLNSQMTLLEESKLESRIRKAKNRQDYRQHKLDAKLEHKLEIEKIHAEARERQRQRQHEINLIETAVGGFIFIIMLLYWISKHH